MARRRWIRVLGALVGIALLARLFQQSDLRKLSEALRTLPPLVPFGVIFFCVVARILQGLRFYVLYPAGFSALEHIGMNFAGKAVNLLIPLRAGELVRPALIKDRNLGVTWKQLLTWTLVDKFVESFAFGFFVLFAALVARHDPRLDFLEAFFAPTAALLVISCVVWVFFRGPRFREQMPDRDIMGLAFGLSAAMWAANVLIFASASGSFKLALPLFIGASLAAAIPGLPGGLGAFEAGYVWVAQAGGMPLEVAFAQALVAHLIQFIPNLFFGSWYLVRTGVSFDQFPPKSFDTQENL